MRFIYKSNDLSIYLSTCFLVYLSTYPPIHLYADGFTLCNTSGKVRCHWAELV